MTTKTVYQYRIYYGHPSSFHDQSFFCWAPSGHEALRLFNLTHPDRTAHRIVVIDSGTREHEVAA